jgi:hypothetical protein
MVTSRVFARGRHIPIILLKEYVGFTSSNSYFSKVSGRIFLPVHPLAIFFFAGSDGTG